MNIEQHTMIYYEVRFVFYQYNGGGAIHNGDIACKEKFNNLEDAKKFDDKLKDMLNSKVVDQKFIEQYVWSGFLESRQGIYEITEKRLT